MGAKWSARGIAVLIALSAGLLAPVAARGATGFTDFDLVGIPQEGATVTLSLIGDADPGRSLFVFVVPGASTCPATAAILRTLGQDELTPVPDGDPAGSPSFDQDYPFTVPMAGDLTLCAYLGLTAGTPDDSLEIGFVADPAPLSIDLHDPTPAEQSPWPLGSDVTWSYRVVAPGADAPARTAFILGRDGDQPCGATAAAEEVANGGVELAGGQGSGTYTGVATTRRRWRPYRLCAYLSASRGAPPDAVDTVLITPKRPSPVTVNIDGIKMIENIDLYSRVWVNAVANGPTGLYVLVHRGTAPCGQTIDEEIARHRGIDVTFSQPPGERVAGATRGAFSFSVPDVLEHRVCAYAASYRDEPPYGVASATFTAEPDPTLKAVLSGPAPGARARSGSAAFTWQADRLRLPPVRVPGAGFPMGDLQLLSAEDRLALYRTNPDGNRRARLVGRYDPDRAGRWHRVGFDLRGGSWFGQYTVTVTRPLSPGRYWWRVERSRTLAGQGLRFVRAGASQARSVLITGSPALTKLSARSTVVPAYVILAVVAAPRTTLQLTVRRGGSTIRRVSGATGGSARTTLAVPISCRHPGRYRYTMRAADAYGNRRTTTGSWRVSPCG